MKQYVVVFFLWHYQTNTPTSLAMMEPKTEGMNRKYIKFMTILSFIFFALYGTLVTLLITYFVFLNSNGISLFGNNNNGNKAIQTSGTNAPTPIPTDLPTTWMCPKNYSFLATKRFWPVTVVIKHMCCNIIKVLGISNHLDQQLHLTI